MLYQHTKQDMRPTVTPVLMKQKKLTNGTFPIYIRITANRESSYINAKVWVKLADWNERRRQVRSSDLLSESKNNTIQRICTEANLAAENHRTAAAVKSEILKGYSGVFQFLDEYIDDLEKKGQYWEVKKFLVTKTKMLEVFKPSLKWIQLTHRELVNFERHLRNVRGNANNTIYNEMKRVRRMFNMAHADRLVSADDNPFLRYQMPKKTTPARRRLSFEEIERIMTLELDEGSKLKLARDVFVFAYFAGGMRFSDLCVLSPDNFVDGRVVYASMKTGQRVANMLPEHAFPFLHPYLALGMNPVFPLIHERSRKDPVVLRRQISSKNVMVNYRLKTVAVMAGIDPQGITMHVARHSVANEAQAQGHDVRAIQSMLGHKKVTTTTGYMDELNLQRNDKLMTALWATTP